MYKLTMLALLTLFVVACANENSPKEELNEEVSSSAVETPEEQTKKQTAEMTAPNYPPLLTGNWKLTKIREESATKEQSFILHLMEDSNLLMEGNNRKVNGNWRYEKEAETEFLYISLEVAPEERPNKIMSLDQEKMILLDKDTQLTFERVEQ